MGIGSQWKIILELLVSMKISLYGLFYFCYNKLGGIMQYNFLKDNIIVVCSNQIKLNIIDYCISNKKIYNIKYMSLNELIEILTYSYDEKTIVGVMDKFNLSYELAKMYLMNIKYADFESDDKRVLFLKEIIDYCKENNLFKRDELIISNILKKEIVIIDDNFGLFEKNVLDKYDIRYTLIDRLSLNYEVNECYEAKTLEEEIHFVAEEICNLISSGVEVKNIVLSNVDNESDAMIKQIFKMYNIPYNSCYQSSLFDTNVGKFFLENLSDNIDDTLNKVKERFKDSELINRIIDCLNKYYFIKDFRNYKDILIEEFKNTRINSKKLKNAVQVRNFKNSIFSDNEYVFLIGFNLGVIPNTYKDEDYISDNIKPNYLETTLEKNVQEKELAKKILTSIKNLTISYKLNYLNEAFYPSNLVNEMNLHVNKIDSSISKYSVLANKINLGRSLDLYRQFGVKNNVMPTLLYNYSDIPYNTFSNKFKGINFNKEMMLSYSSMDTYYKCAFRYYLANVLKIDIFNENFSQYIGNLFHHVLEVCLNSNEDIDKVYDEFILNNEYEFSEKNKFFLDNLRDEIKFIIETIKEQYSYSEYKTQRNEEKIEIDEDGIRFKGFIDKILMKDDKWVIIDYKTGSIDINLANVEYGLSMQLPVYLYLAKKMRKDVKIVGFYLQHILNNKARRNSKKKYENLKRDALKLQGYSLGNEEYLNEFDSSFRDSNVIKSMKMGNNGFYHYSKVLTENEIDNLITIVDKKIKEATNDIKSGNFTINPKIIGKNNEGCAFCKFKDICFLEENDKIYLEQVDDLSFLGGDGNA